MKLNLKLPFAKEEELHGTWQGTETRMTDEEAHRNVTYSIPSGFSQTVIIFKSQMQIFSKRKSIYVLVLMGVLIPLLYLLLKDSFKTMTMFYDGTSNGMMGMLLCMFPFILGIFTASICGKLMPNEFINRTAYMNMALPISRLSFCVGKYLASLVITIGVCVFAYGMALLTAMGDFKYFDDVAIGKSLLMMILSVMVYTTTAFAFGCFMKKGAGILSFLFLVFLIPIICIILMNNNVMTMDQLGYFPNLFPDVSCFLLGGKVAASPFGMYNMIMSIVGVPFLDPSTYSLGIACLIGIIWSLLFFALGTFTVYRREM